MKEIFDLEAWRQVLVTSLTALGSSLAAFVPKLLGMLVILGIGWLVAKLVEIVTSRTLQRLGLDRLATNLNLTRLLARGGVGAPSRLLSRLLFWVLMLTFVITAADSLGLAAVTTTIDRLVAWVPSVIGALLIVILGVLGGRLTRNVVTSGAMAANVSQAPRLGGLAYGFVILLVAVLAVEELGIQTDVLVTVITALVSAAALTAGIAFAIGARPIVTHILAGHFLRRTLSRGDAVEFGGHKGTVEEVGALETVFQEGTRAWLVPNGKLLEEVKALLQE